MANKPNITAKLNRPLVLLLLAASLAGGVAWIANHYLNQREETIKNELAAQGRKSATPTVGVVVPNIDAGIGTVLTKNIFVSRPVEEDLVYPDTIAAGDFEQFEGHKLARPVLRGRPLRLSDLQTPEVYDVSSILPPGMRAMTIDIDNLNSIAGTLKPNHRIDIFLLSKAPKRGDAAADHDGNENEQATLFMQNMIVLATGTQFEDVSGQNGERTAKMVRPGDVEGATSTGFDSITLLVKPAEAARLMIGQKMGSYRVVLRGGKDRAPLALAPLRSSDLTPKALRARDAGVDFIVGGRGGAVSKLPESQSVQLAQYAGNPSRPGSQLVYTGKPVSPASLTNQPIPALRGQ